MCINLLISPCMHGIFFFFSFGFFFWKDIFLLAKQWYIFFLELKVFFRPWYHSHLRQSQRPNEGGNNFGSFQRMPLVKDKHNLSYERFVYEHQLHKCSFSEDTDMSHKGFANEHQLQKYFLLFGLYQQAFFILL